MSKSYNVDVNDYVNKLSEKEFKKILDTPGGDRDHVIFNIDLNRLEPNKLIVLVKHEAYELKNARLVQDDQPIDASIKPADAGFKVIKRDGRPESLDPEKIYERIRKLWRHAPKLENISEDDLRRFTAAVIKGIYNGISTSELDEQAAIIAAHMTTKHPEYGILASRIAISNHEKNLRNYSFMGVVEKLYRNKDKRGNPYPLVSKDLYKFVGKNKAWIEGAIDYSRDFNFDFFGFKTLERSYLLKIQKTTMERPQDMLMRVSIGIWLEPGVITEVNPDSQIARRILDTYEGMSEGYFTHASPTLFNSGTSHNQFLSCFLFEVNDSLEGIMGPQTNAAQISKYAGGNGCTFSTVRSRGAYIKGTNGESGGPIPFILNLDATMRAWDQGGRRKGACAVYTEASHPQFMEFCELRTTTGDISQKSRSIFLGTWMPDLFWYRWMNNDSWSSFDPDETMTEEGSSYGSGRYLARMYGDEYEARYLELEKANKSKSTMKAHDMLVRIAAAQTSSGMPYMCYKDSFNRCSNQKNIGVINSSNLCSEIAEVFDEDEYACCTLASMCLPKFVVDVYDEDEAKAFDSSDSKDPVRPLDHKFPKNPRFDFVKLAKYVRIATRNLNTIIDKNKYPVHQTKLFNLRHRTLGIGAQGLADVYHKMKVAWGSPEARELNKMIFETIYYAALVESCEIARETYQSYAAIARKEGKVRVPIDYQSRPVIHKATITKYDGKLDLSLHTPHVQPYQRNRFSTEWIVEPIYQEFVLSGMPNPDKLPILPKTIGAYSSFVGSPISEGKFHFDMKNDESDYLNAKNARFVETMDKKCKEQLEVMLGEPLLNFLHRKKFTPSKLWEWESLREKVKTFGIRNAQLVALMPTSSTSQIMGNNECIEPYTENMYKRTTLAGDFIVVNPYLIKELCDLKLWNESVENNIKVNNGSVQFLEVPEDIFGARRKALEEALSDIKYRYRTAYELSQKILIEDAADRGFCVDQSQSLNLHNAGGNDLRSIIGMHFLGWALGLKTGMYYLRSRQAMTAQKFTISAKDTANAKRLAEAGHENNQNELTYEEIQKRKTVAQLALTQPSETCLSCSS